MSVTVIASSRTSVKAMALSRMSTIKMSEKYPKRQRQCVRGPNHCPSVLQTWRSCKRHSVRIRQKHKVSLQFVAKFIRSLAYHLSSRICSTSTTGSTDHTSCDGTTPHQSDTTCLAASGDTKFQHMSYPMSAHGPRSGSTLLLAYIRWHGSVNVTSSSRRGCLVSQPFVCTRRVSPNVSLIIPLTVLFIPS